MSYTSNSSIPGLRDQSYVMLVLAVGTLKRNVFEMVAYNSFPKEQEEVLVNYGVKVLEGSASVESYISKLESICKSIVSKSIKFDDNTKQHLLGRLNLSRTATTINQTLDKQTLKKVKHDGTLKQMTETLGDDGNFHDERFSDDNIDWKFKGSGLNTKEDPRFRTLPQEMKNLVVSTAETTGLADKAPKNIITKEKLDYIVKRLSYQIKGESSAQFTPEYISKIERFINSVNINNLTNKKNQFRPEPIVKDFQLNSTIREENENKIDDARYNLLSRADKRNVQLALFDMGLIQRLDEPVTSQKINFLITRLKKAVSIPTTKNKHIILRVLTVLDPKDWKTFRPEPVVRDFELNSVSKDKELLDEAVDRQQVKDIIKQKGSVTMLDLLAALGIRPTQPPNGQQVAVFLTLKSMLVKGEVTRTKEGRGFKYSIGSGVPTPITPTTSPTPKVTTSSKNTPQGYLTKLDKLAILGVLNNTWSYRGTWEGEKGSYYLATDDRGPRTDHGGGDDGDGWMSSGQIARVAKPYEEKWNPRLKSFVARLKEKDLKVKNAYVDYGEKGHVSLNLELNLEKLK